MKLPGGTKRLLQVAVLGFGIYGALWTLRESRGLKGTWRILLSWAGVPFLLASGYRGAQLLVKHYRKSRKLQNDLEALTAERDSLRLEKLELDRRPTSHCCVVQTNESVCPVGIKRVHTKMADTLVESLKSAKYRFHWHGLSAFNVVHNNRDQFKAHRDVDYRFSICNPSNVALAEANNRYFSDTAGKLDSGKLITEGDGVLRALRDELKLKMDIQYHNFVPCFRIVVVDEATAYVNFYERQKDALETFQLEIGRDAQYPVFNWFKEYLDKVSLNETFRTTQADSRGVANGGSQG